MEPGRQEQADQQPADNADRAEANKPKKLAESANQNGPPVRGQIAAAWLLFIVLVLGLILTVMFLVEANDQAKFTQYAFSCALIGLAEIGNWGTGGSIIVAIVIAGAGYALRVQKAFTLWLASLILAFVLALIVLSLALVLNTNSPFWSFFDNLTCAMGGLDVMIATQEEIDEAVKASVVKVDALFFKAFIWVVFVIGALVGIRAIKSFGNSDGDGGAQSGENS